MSDWVKRNIGAAEAICAALFLLFAALLLYWLLVGASSVVDEAEADLTQVKEELKALNEDYWDLWAEAFLLKNECSEVRTRAAKCEAGLKYYEEDCFCPDLEMSGPEG